MEGLRTPLWVPWQGHPRAEPRTEDARTLTTVHELVAVGVLHAYLAPACARDVCIQIAHGTSAADRALASVSALTSPDWLKQALGRVDSSSIAAADEKGPLAEPLRKAAKSADDRKRQALLHEAAGRIQELAVSDGTLLRVAQSVARLALLWPQKGQAEEAIPPIGNMFKRRPDLVSRVLVDLSTPVPEPVLHPYGGDTHKPKPKLKPKAKPVIPDGVFVTSLRTHVPEGHGPHHSHYDMAVLFTV